MSFYESVPLSPEELPQQRLVAVKTLPECPPDFDVMAPAPAELIKDFQEIGEHGTTSTLASVEWAWSPMHSRIDTYVLERGPAYSLLWNRIPPGIIDDDEYQILMAAAPQHEVDDRTAALWLLHGALESGRSSESLDCFHHVNFEGLLSVADLRALAVSVWGD